VNTRADRYPLMDSMRAISVVSVVLTHVSFHTAFQGGGQTQVRFGFISVTIFFMTSAFLLYGPFVRARLDDVDPPSLKGFAWRRFLRVVPAYYVALTIIALAFGFSFVFSAQGIPTFYGFAQVYRPDWALLALPQAWTLCVEVSFYALLPLWAAFMRRRRAGSREQRVRQELIAAGLLVLVSFAYKAVIVATGVIDGHYGATLQLNLLTFMDDFAIGMALATIAVAYRGRDRQPAALVALDRYPSIAWGIAAAALGIGIASLGLLGQVGDLNSSGAPYVVRHYLIEVIAAGVLLPGMFGDPQRGFVRRILRNRVLLYLGLVSYGIYLWHFAVLDQLSRWDFGSVAGRSTALWFAVALPMAVALATLSYYIVERPFLRLKGLVNITPEPRPDESIAERAPATPTAP
jgi:peptidoglycan/LPS O-acetylase OafA/YrhL